MLEKFKGCLVGLAVGDYLGMPVEFCKPSQVKQFYPNGLEPKPCKRGNSSYPAGFYTDDTAMAICLAESIIENGFDVKDQFLRYRKWLMEGYNTPLGDKAYGVGQNTLRQLFTSNPNNLPDKLNHKENQGGNGALMRCSPIALVYYKDEKELFKKTLSSTIITHNNEIAAWTCIAHNHFISYAIKNYEKSSYTPRFISTYPECPEQLKVCLQGDISFKTTGYSLNSLEISVYSFLNTKTYHDCVEFAIFLGGDTDTQGAITGSLAGAYYGYSEIPKAWVNKLLREDFIVDLATKIYEKHGF